MDDKTLEYMGERVDKARKIIEFIKSKTKDRTTIENSTVDRVYTRNGNLVYIPPDAQEGVKNSVLNELDAIIAQKQKELDEL